MAARVVCANGHPNDNVGEEMRFCQQCGAPLEVHCSNEHVSPMGRRFCPSCGESLVPVEQYPPPAPAPQPEHAQPMPTVGRPRAEEKRRGPMILVIACVVVVLAAAAGGAVVVLHKHSGGPKPGNDAVSRTSSTAKVSTTLQNTTTSSPAATVPASTIPTTTLPPPTTLPANMVAVKTSAVASNPLSTDVAQTFSTYFGGINDRKWAQAYSAYGPSYQQDVTLQSFESVDATSSDMDVAVMSIDEGAGGTLSVGVDFTSHQAAANGPSGETCTQWSLTYMLVPSAGGGALDYLIQSAKGNDSACPA
jgi:hypothetical protein